MEFLTDEELIEKAKTGDVSALDFLFAKYKNLVTKITRRYYLAGYENDDLIQEGMIGLYKAYQNFIPGKEFKSFASVCITHQILSAIKSANRMKNKVLTESISLNNQGGILIRGDEDDEDDELFYTIRSVDFSPEDKLISRENVKEIKTQVLEKLSSFEKQILSYYLKGHSYEEISKLTNKPIKSVDNALSRIKSKLNFLRKK